MWKWLVGLLALSGAVGGTLSAFQSVRSPPVPPPQRAPLRSPYRHAIAGAGLVEPQSENIVVGAPVAGVVTKVWVARGSEVEVGAPLFRIDTRALEAERVVAAAEVVAAEAALARVRAYRRPEEEPVLCARLAGAKAALAQAEAASAEAKAGVEASRWTAKNAESRRSRAVALSATDIVSEEDVDDATAVAEAAKATLAGARAGLERAEASTAAFRARAAEAQAELDLFLAGPWAADVAKAQAEVEEARARVERLRLEIERQTARAPISGTVLRCLLHEGEVLSAEPRDAEHAPLVVGAIQPLHVRVDIDEFDAVRFDPEARASAFLKGQVDAPIALSFVAAEPFVVPKRALTNSQTEFVDARVLQVIYAIEAPQPRVWVGQQMDVFIEARE